MTASDPPGVPDRLTLIATSALAYLSAVGLHEHLGHSTACVLLGGHVKQMGAFYVDCDYGGMSSVDVRIVALAGPVISAVTALICLLLLSRSSVQSSVVFFFVWLLGSVAAMDVAGYALFSGFSGIGDLGFDPAGALHQASPEWLWRVALVGVSYLAYRWVVRVCLRPIEARAAGVGPPRIKVAQQMALTAYVTGAVLYLLIGLLNPRGLLIVVISALPASLGGTSGLLWMMRLLDKTHEVPPPGLYFARSWAWIGVAVIFTAAYAAILGPTLQ